MMYVPRLARASGVFESTRKVWVVLIEYFAPESNRAIAFWNSSGVLTGLP